MILKRAAAARGHADHGWLRTWHSFSFADYFDPAETGWGALRVINEDIVAPGQGFPLHPHRDMEIVTVLLSGALEHRDSLGNGAVIRAGEIQCMSAGSGVRHSEFNPARDEATHLLQIWIVPQAPGGAPDYEQRTLPARAGATLLASPDGRDGSARIGQQAWLSRVRLGAGEAFTAPLAPGRRGYVHVIAGELAAGGHDLLAGDGLKLVDEDALRIAARSAGDFLYFDLPD